MSLVTAILLLGGSSSSLICLPQVKQTSPESQQESQRVRRDRNDYRLKNNVNVRIIEYFDQSNIEEHYHQERPLIVDTETGTFKYDSECHWLTGIPLEPEAKVLIPVTFPMVIPEWRFPPPRVLIPDPIFIPPVTKPGVRPGLTRASNNLQLVTKPKGFSDEELSQVTPDNRGGGVMIGPQIQVPLPAEITRWLPFEATVSVYGSILFGETEVYGLESDVESYSLGVRMNIPIPLNLGFSVNAYGFAGHGWLLTDFGNATGVDTGAGLQTAWQISEGVSLSLSVEARGYYSENVSGTGYGIVPGINIAW